MSHEVVGNGKGVKERIAGGGGGGWGGGRSILVEERGRGIFH